MVWKIKTRTESGSVGDIDIIDVDSTISASDITLDTANITLTAGTFSGDGSSLTNVTPDMQDNQWFYMNTADTKGVRWNTSTSDMEFNDSINISSGSIRMSDTEIIDDAYEIWNLTGVHIDLGSALYLDGTSGTKSLLYSSGNAQFEFNDDVDVNGNFEALEGLFTADLTVNGGDFYIDANQSLILDAGAVGKDLQWNSGNARFQFNDNLYVNGTGEFTGAFTIGAYTLPNTDGTADQVLQTDGGGAVSWSSLAALAYFDAYDNTGGTDISAGWTDVPLDTERQETADFTHTGSSAEVTVNTTGTYVVTARVTTDVTSGTNRSEAEMRLSINTGGGHAAVDGTVARMYARQASQGEATGTVMAIMSLNSGDILKIEAQRVSGTSTVNLLVDGSSLTIHNLIVGQEFTSEYWDRTGTELHPSNTNDTLGLEGDAVIDLNRDGVAKTLHYDTTATRFEFNDAVDISGNVEATSVTSTGNVEVSGGDIFLDTDQHVDFNYGGAAKTLLWVSANTRFQFNDKLYCSGDFETDGDIYLIGTTPNTLYGGDAASDVLNIRANSSDATPVITMTGGGDTDINSATTIGDGGTTNYSQFDVDGHLTMTGGARVTKCIQFYPYNIGGIAGTYNSIACNASGLASLNGIYFKSYDDGGGAAIAEASNVLIMLPDDYVDGTDIVVKFGMIVGGVSTNDVRWQCGETHVSDTDTYSPSTYTWATPQNVAGPGTAWERKDVTFTLSGTGIVKGDAVSIIVFRDADNAADNYAGDAYHADIRIEYTSDRIGAKV